MQFRILGPIEAVVDDQTRGARRAETARAARAAARQPQARRDSRAADRRALGRGTAGVGRPVAAGLRARAAPRARRRADRDRGPRLPRRRRGRTSSTSTASSARSSAAGRLSRPAARTTRPTTCAEALAVWRGPALADLPDETRRAAEAERLEELRLSALELRIDAELALGRHDAVVAELEALTAEQPYRERLPPAADARALPLRPPGGGARGLPRRPRRRSRGARPRARARAAGAGARDPAAGPEPRRAGSADPLDAAAARCPRRRSSAAGSSSRRSARCFRDEGARLVTLTGPGGTGKTRLALAVADELEPELARRRAVRRPRAGREPGAGRADDRGGARACEKASEPLADGVTEHLRERRLLLVLDNFEQMLAARAVRRRAARRGPAPVDPRHEPRAAAARGRARVPGAAARRCPTPTCRSRRSSRPTRCGSSRRARTRSIPRFELDETSAPAVAAICRRLDGLPLAIELAAARAKLLAPGEILERLERELDLLRRRRATRRPASRRCARRSTGATTCSARTSAGVFARLGVFAGGCTLEAAEARLRRRRSRASARWSTTTCCGERRRPLHDARDGARVRGRAARGGRGRRGAPTARGVADRARRDHGGSERSRAKTSRSGSIGSSRSTTTSGPRSPGRSSTSPSSRCGWRAPSGSSGRYAATSAKGTAGSRRRFRTPAT